MKILIYARPFFPSIGGIEEITRILATGLVERGCQVVLITKTGINNSVYVKENFPFKILRNPNWSVVMKEFNRCDIFMMQGPSIRMFYPFLINPLKRVVFVHHMCKPTSGLSGIIIKIVSRFVHNVTVSNYVGKSMGLKKYKVIYNCYDEKIYKNYGIVRTSDLGYRGNISEVKGCITLINAFELFKNAIKSHAKLYLIGKLQPYSNIVLVRARQSKYCNDIIFIDRSGHKEACDYLNHIKIAIMPSDCNEAFGISTLEMMASGCYLIGSDGDGIKEAMNGCGMLFKKGDAFDLCKKIIEASNLSDLEIQKNNQKAQEWLSQLTTDKVCDRYYDYFLSLSKTK